MEQVAVDPRDAEHLRMLKIGHYVLAALIAFFSLIFTVHIAIGIGMLSGAIKNEGEGDARVAGMIFTGVGLVLVVLGLLVAALVAYAGKSIDQRKNFTFIFIVALVACLFTPLGTILGIFTIITIQKPSVKALFGKT